MIVAKRTTYQTMTYRSRLEARWAKYLTTLNIPFSYEPELINLGALRYLPDFKLPGYPLWLEIKGEIVNDETGLTIISKCELLARLTSIPVVLAFYDPLDQKCAAFMPSGRMLRAYFGMCPECGGLAVRGPDLLICPHPNEQPLTIERARSCRRLLFDAANDARDLWSRSPMQ